MKELQKFCVFLSKPVWVFISDDANVLYSASVSVFNCSFVICEFLV